MDPQQPPSAPTPPPNQPAFEPPQDTPAPPEGPDYNPRMKVGKALTVTREGEVTIAVIKRHPIGIIAIYAAIATLLFILVVLAFLLAPAVIADSASEDQVRNMGLIAFIVLAFILMVYGLIATKVYWGNMWVVTSDSVTQIQQTSLFNRQSAQLALVNIEDVTAEKNGILAHIFNYGVIKAATASHHGKFTFAYCPNPDFYAQRILAAREALGPAAHQHGHI